MKLAIWTHWEGKSWEGEIPDWRVPAPTDTLGKLEYIFRFFNRVDTGDSDRLVALGYLLPSLSVDDVITLEGEHWLVKPAGFEKVHSIGLPYPVRPTDEPCVVCGKLIWPGQLYIPDGDDSPRHFGCES